MKITISFKHLEHTPALDGRIRSKSKKIEKLIPNMKEIKWVCYAKDGHHVADLQCLVKSSLFKSRGKSDSLYKSLDMAIDKVTKQLSKRKDKQKNHIHGKDGTKTLEILDPEAAWSDYDEDNFDDVA